MKRLKRIRDTNLESDLKTQVIKHTADALASMSDEGRGRLRNASRSCLASFDPEMSEWGNPAWGNLCYWQLNS